MKKSRMRYYIKIGRMLFGFALISLGVLIRRQTYCFAPWNVLDDGVSKLLEITLGTSSILVGVVFVTIAILLREKIGFGMILNILFCGWFTDLFIWINNGLQIIPRIHSVPWQVFFAVVALFVTELGIYYYMSAEMGAGPRDSVIVGISKRVPFPVGACQIALEAIGFTLGWRLGGEIGIGTLVSVSLGGPILQLYLKLFSFDVKSARNESISDTIKITKQRKNLL